MEIDRLNSMFSELVGEGSSREWIPPADIYETEQHELVIKAELPEMKREDIGVTFENNVLTLKGLRVSPGEVRPEGFQRWERRYGTFARSFTVPAAVDAGRISASYRDGVLTVRLPQRDEAKAKQIAVGE